MALSKFHSIKNKLSNSIIGINTSSSTFKVICILLAVACCCIVSVTKGLEPDIFWHTKNGITMLHTKTWLFKDMYSWSMLGRNASTQEWLFDLIVGTINSSGLKYIYLLILLFTAGLFFSLLYTISNTLNNDTRAGLLSKISGKSIMLSLLLTLSATPFITLRPQSTSYIVLVWFIYFLNKDKYLTAFFLAILESNLHGGMSPFFAGIAIIIVFKKKQFKYILPFLITMIINPSNFGTLEYSIDLITCKEFNYVNEWSKSQLAYFPVATVSIFLALVSIFYKSVPRLKDIIIVFVLFMFSLVSTRNVPVIALTLACMYIKNIERLIIDFRVYFHKWFFCAESCSVANRKVMDKIFTIFITLLVPIVFTLGFILITGSKPHLVYNIENSTYTPVYAVDYIKEHKLTKVLNFYDCGGYLLYRDVPVFVDSRGDLYTYSVNKVHILRDFNDLTYHANLSLIDKYKPNYIMCSNSTTLNLVLQRTSYQKVYSDDEVSIYKVENNTGGNIK